MTKLANLQRQLARLRRYRWLVKTGAALSAAAAALLWTLLVLFAIDVLFQLPVTQRAVVGLLGLAVLGVVFRRHVLPWFGLPEDALQLALQVERRQGLRNDLIAGLEFEQSVGSRHGSAALREAVVLRTSELAEQLDVFHGESSAPLPRRAAMLLLTAAVAVTLALTLPGHARAFFNRMLLGSDHYPTRTRLASVLINEQLVLQDGDASMRPRAARCAQGTPLAVAVRCSGMLPESGRIRLRSRQQRAEAELRPLSVDERQRRLKDARNAARDEAPDWDRVAALARLDAPPAAELARQTAPAADQVVAALNEALARPEAQWSRDPWYYGELPRAVGSLEYQLFFGDAWTEPASIEMIPLPVMEVAAQIVAPDYAGGAATEPQAARLLRVLEGSRVELRARSVTGKPLQAAWMSLAVDGEPPQRVELRPVDDDRVQWTLPPDGTPLAALTEPVRFELQVRDKDGLAQENPLRGQIRVRPDRPPTGSLEVVHRVVLPTATPGLTVKADDDFGIAELRVHLQVERPSTDDSEPLAPGETASPSQPASRPAAPDATARPERTTRTLPDTPLLAAKLPYRGRHPLALAPLQLVKGDRLKITLEVLDQRGDAPGRSFLAEPVVLEVSDEAGVMAAIAESDEQSERRLTELIQQQLGIGDSP